MTTTTELHVVSTDIQNRAGTVTIGGPTQESVMSPAAKHLAINTAQADGLTRAGLSGNEVAYPVDAAGNTSDDLILGRGGQAVSYRCDYNLTAGL